jgi:hypothetical protein
MISALPDANSVAVMRDIDSLPGKWRALVHEYGYKIVMAMFDNGFSLEDADDACWMRRSAKQAEWLSTNYITKKTARNYF